jgi:uncharacterized protein
VLIAGPRQAGKTTLAEEIARDGFSFFNLDNKTTLQAAKDDPVGFIRETDRAVIDEVQRAPELLLAIKESVDKDRRPGRFLLTGSANLMTLPLVADSLAGRMEVIRLLPLAVSEVEGSKKDVFGALFHGDIPEPAKIIVGQTLVELVLAGGYPEALTRKSWLRKHNWHLDYIDAIISRDVRDIANIEDMSRMPQLIRVLAEHSGNLVNYSGIGASTELNHVTTRKYVGVFESLFLVRSMPSWHTNRLKRLVKTAKLHFLDAGLLAALRDVVPLRVKDERGLFGPILESFVFSELLKLASWSGMRLSFSHFRDKEKHEVDIVVEDNRGRVVGIEVKAGATATSYDFKGLRQLKQATGDKFICGLVLYDHEKIIPFGERLFAAPLSILW